MVEEKEYKINDLSPAGEFVIEFLDASEAPLPDIEVKITVDSNRDFSGKTRSNGSFRTAKPQSAFNVSLMSGAPATGSTAPAQTVSAEAGPDKKQASACGRGEGVEPPVTLA